MVADPAERDVVCVVPGKDANTVKEFARDFMDHNGDPDHVRLVTCDMSPGFAKGIREHLPNAHRIIDRFHMIRHANEAVDKVRKAEAGDRPMLGRHPGLFRPPIHERDACSSTHENQTDVSTTHTRTRSSKV